MAEVAMTVVGWFVVPALIQMLQKSYNFLSEDTRAKTRTLEIEILPRLEALIKDAKLNEQQSNTLHQLLIELQTAAYEAEDAIDKVEYEHLEQQAMGKVEKVVSKVTSIPSNLASKWNISGILKELEAKVTRMNGFIGSLLAVSSNIQPTTRTTTMSMFTGEVFGRSADRNHIVRFLTATATPNGSDMPKIKVAAILGVGGVGKTVLASYVFNDDKICDHFGPKMWLHVPEKFDEAEMTRTMIDLIPGIPFASNTNTMEVLQKELQKRLRVEKQKMFLLVLDDVWYDEKLSLHQNKERWSRLCAPLSNGTQGGMILITSRMEKVAKLFPGETKLFFLKGLKEKDCLAIFNKHAFDVVDPPAPRTVEEEDFAKEIVAEISTKLGGLPLAAMAAGNLLKDRVADNSLKLNRESGREIKKNIIHGDLRNTLLWSYQKLSPEFQQCIAHLSLYPRGFKFHPTSLALSWLGTGVVLDQNNLMGVRFNYFDELVSRSFFQRAGEESFVLHSLLHDVVDSVPVNEFMRITGRKSEIADIPHTIKHLSIEVKMLVDYKEKICQLTKLRTLFLTGSNSCSNSKSVAIVDYAVLKAILKKTTRLRALSLASCSIAKLPKSIGDLTHLRFLDLSNSSVNRLPKTVCKLYHLCYLNLKNCRLDHMPRNLKKLTQLSHLIVSDGATLSMIPHIGRLTALQELKEFHVREERGHELGQLEDLNLLQGTLHVVNLERVAEDSEAHKAKLTDKHGLTELVLEWGTTREGPVAVPNQLKLPSDITNLTLRGYTGVIHPSWVCVNLSHLKTLVLNNCSELRYMPPLPTNLRKLVLYGCSQVPILTKEELQTTDVQQKRIDFQSRQVVIKEGQVKKSLMINESVNHVLQELKMSLEERGLPQDATSPPLTSLDRWVVELKLKAISEKLARTPQVNHIEQLPSTLQHLQLHDCFVDDSTLSECLESLTSLISLELSKCMCITSLPLNTVCCLLLQLKVLRVMDCVLLTSLGGIRELTSLKEFKVSSCPNLLAVVPSDDVGTSRGNAFLPDSLVDLRITDCGLLDDEKLSRCLMGLTWLTLLELHNCAHVTSLPSAAELGRLESLEHLSLYDCADLASVGGLHVLMTSLNYLLVEKCPKLLVPPTAVATVLAVPAIGATGDVILASADPITGTASASAPPTVGVVPTTPPPLTVAAALAPPTIGATSAITLASTDLSASTASAVAATTTTALTVVAALAPPTIGATGAVTLASADPIVCTASTAAPPTACGVPTTPSPLTVAAALAPPTIGAISVVTLASTDPIVGTASAAAPTAGVVAATPTPLTAGTDVSTASVVPDTPAPTGGAALVADAAAIALAPLTTGDAPAPPTANDVSPFTCKVIVDDLSLLPKLLLGDRLASLKMLVIESPRNTAFTPEQQGCLGQVTSLQVLSFKNCERLPFLPSNLDSLTSLKLLELQNCPQLREVPTLLPESLKFIDLLDCHHELDQMCQQTLGEQVDVSFLGYQDYGDVIDW